jgi:hypothetical protein
MSEHGDKMLDRIARAYDEATRGTDAPAWDALGPALRGAFIAIYSLGRKDALDERG